MLPVAQLDPSSLTLWLNPELIAAAPGADTAIQAADLAATHSLAEVVSFVEELPDSATRIRAAHLASMVWHEQRHFVDLALTNYGAFRVRQFFKLYVNMYAVLGELQRTSQSLFCPIDSYADPVRRLVFDLESAPEAIVDLAANVLAHSGMLRDERQLIPTPLGTMEMGGEAQLEAVAFFSQINALQTVFGTEIMIGVQRSHAADFRGMRYRWAAMAAHDLGLVSSKKVGDDYVELRIDLLAPVLIGSLAARRYGQAQVRSETQGGSGFPAERLYGFIRAFTRDAKIRNIGSTMEGWELVNRTAKELWGRTVLEEIEEDYRHEEALCERIEAHPIAPDPAKAAYRDYHSLRGQFINLLRSDPLTIIDPVVFSRSLLPIIRPQTIYVRNGGTLGEPPDGFLRVLGYHDTEDPTNEEAKWWWAVTRRPEENERGVALENWKAWLPIVEELAPLAKLMLHGRRHRIMLGPELIAAELRVRALGIPVRFDPHFEYPEEPRNPDQFWTQTERTEARCDFCKAVVAKGHGQILGPWFFRRHSDVADIAIKALGGGKTGRLRFWRDWSVWLVCDDCGKSVVSVFQPTDEPSTVTV